MLKDIRIRYGLYGLVLGLVIPLILRLIFTRPSSRQLIQSLMQDESLIMLADSAPLFLGLGFLLIGLRLHRSEQKNRHMIEQKVKQEARFLENTVNQLPALFYAKDLKGRFVITNEAFCNFFACCNKEVIGNHNRDIFDEPLASRLTAVDQQTLESREVMICEESFCGPSGKNTTFLAFRFPYLDERDEIYATGGIYVDVTEKKVMEQQTLHAAKLAAIGELAVGVGHEINTPLAVATGNIDRLKSHLSESSPNFRDLIPFFEKIDEASGRIVKIVSGLKTFARPDPDSSENFDLARSLVNTISWLKDIYKSENITLHFRNHCIVPPVIRGNQGRIEQVILNLLANAKDALIETGGGKIEVDLMATEGEDRLVVTVKDNGVGMVEDTLGKIFDSFYTTKTTGTGIGLSLSRAIVSEHGGEISAQSEPGEGSVFTMSFPASPDPAHQHTQEASLGNETLDLSGMRALIVDDEPGIRELLRLMLENSRCQVIEAADGLEALSLAEKQDFDMVFTDLKMPRMGGNELAGELSSKQLVASAHIFALTGGVNKPTSKTKLFAGYLSKPFKEQDLIAMLRKGLVKDIVLSSINENAP